jgi:hypothetical protein
MAQVANRRFVIEAITQFNRLTPEELAVKVQGVPTSNLAVLRDAVRIHAGTLLPQDVEMVVRVVTVEIERRWA